MIQIRHENIEQICFNYSTSIVDTIKKKTDELIFVINLIKQNRDIESGEITKDHSQALCALFNNASLASNTNDILALNFNKNRNVNPGRYSNILDIVQYSSIDKVLIELIRCNPDRLLLHQRYVRILLSKRKIYINDYFIKYFFDYKHCKPFIDLIADELGVKVCPYCNRNYITSVSNDDEKIIGPTFDHYFHQKENPILSLCFYNLIPSCYICNSNLKNQKRFRLSQHLHPYINEMGSDAKFTFNFTVSLGSNQKINFTPRLEVDITDETDEKYIQLLGDGRTENSGSIKVFKLNEIYSTHNDTVEEIYLKFDKNSPHYINSFAKELKSLGVSESDFYRFHFGNYHNPEDFHKKPLSKLTKDIYENLISISPQYAYYKDSTVE